MAAQVQPVLRQNKVECFRHAARLRNFQRGSAKGYVANDALKFVAALFDKSGLGHTKTPGSASFNHQTNPNRSLFEALRRRVLSFQLKSRIRSGCSHGDVGWAVFLKIQ
jgi:hypothetical protein